MTNVKTRFILFAVALATVAGGASAQPYTLQGSDTLEVVMKDTIKRLNGTLTYGTVVMPGWLSNTSYIGGGSGAGESAVTGNKQSIAAMSRNLTGNPGGTVVGQAAAVCVDANLVPSKTTCTVGADAPCVTSLGAGSTCANAALYCSGTANICATTADCTGTQTCTGPVPVGRFVPNDFLNVVGLDAAVLVEFKANTAIKDLKRVNLVATYGDITDTTSKFIPNLWGICSATPSKRCAVNGLDASGANAGCPTAAETCIPDANTSYNNAFEVLLSGIDGSGSTLACSHPTRLKAIADFGAAQGNQLFRFYRRDDNSGTTDTFKDKVGVGNFCNGKARGVSSNQQYCAIPAVPANPNATPPTPAVPAKIFNTRCTTVTAATDCAAFAGATCPAVLFGFQNPETGAPTGLVSYNLANQDIDPVRFACPDVTTGTLPTNCTNVWTGQYCTSNDNPHDPLTGALSCDPTLPYDGTLSVGAANGCPCTQGFIVALTEGDNTTTLFDVTRTIGSRVAADGGGSMGYAGREAIRSGYNNQAPSIGYSPLADAKIRDDSYVLARRLFLAKAPNNGDAAKGTGESAAGGALKVAQEQLLANFMTADSTTSIVGTSGACNIQDIVKKAGYLGCMADCTANPGAGNICTKTFPVAPTFPAQLVPGQAVNGGPWWDYGPANNFDTAANPARFCAATSPIGSPGTLAWVTAAAGTSCPSALGQRPAGYACATTRDCQSTLACKDDGNGRGILICQ
jgi:hypothetical protein